ncbi:hypothetical protein AJ80_00162 [Polytolypa hystricis UAMH7299]|uniref:Zn(2)-C6 fungal-type domain-containing protein n=1 Tax=Polytolypa hystricis (strain UAMH7299) TaxID=1447883 RepID=A0A2B7Z4H8_POLH7|nr:hypothetical protein AJ80_00162 [Polytolypa hystricis UAMH7299]
MAETGQTSSQRRESWSSRQLACLSCRRKKVKCQPDPAGSSSCGLCAKLQKECYVPEFDERRRTHNKALIDKLRAENARLKAELEDHRTFCLMNDHLDGANDTVLSRQEYSTEFGGLFNNPSPFDGTATSSTSSRSDNMIVRLCGGQRQLNSDRVGRLRFFGPTSSLHLMESVTSSILARESSGINSTSWQEDFPLEVQDYLLDLYWRFHHKVLPCIHKEAFLRDMKNGDTKYCSPLLVYCMLTRAAAISNQPGLRALALAEDADDDAPYLVRKCVQLLETELDAPGITTAQSLQLLSEMHCAISHDTKGWMYAGGAGRLAYELGLHRNSENFDTHLSDLDLQVRQIVFWSCFNLDRYWSLYLGRPQFIKLEDIDAKRPDGTRSDISVEVKMSVAWTSLLEIIGLICDILNGIHTPRHRMETLDQRLRDWNASLDPTFYYSPVQEPPVFLLHMQYAAAMILLHRPLAQFGKDSSVRSSAGEISRQICVDNACLIAQYAQEYYEQHGSVFTMSWIALHIVATAATTLIANIAERRNGGLGMDQQLDSLRKCLGTLNELEKSHVVTRRVRKVIQQAIRLLNLDATINIGATGLNVASLLSGPLPFSLATPNQENRQFPLFDLLPSGPQFDMLNSFESYFT